MDPRFSRSVTMGGKGNRQSLLSEKADEENERTRYGSFNGSVLSDGSFLSDDGTDGKKKIKKTTNPNVKFVDKREWKTNQKCNVCSRVFEKLKGINEHHCRVCGYGVCGDCSKKKINGERSCDICFLKQGIEAHEKRREEIIVSRSERVSKAELMLQKRKDELAQTQRKIHEIKEDMNSSGSQQEKTLQMFYKEKEKGDNYLNQKKETINSLKKGLQINKDVINEKEARLRDLQNKLSGLKAEINQNQSILTQSSVKFQNKKNEYDSLLKVKESIEAQIQQAKANEKEKEIESPASDKVSFVSNISNREFSQEDKKDGKYNISMQPVNI